MRIVQVHLSEEQIEQTEKLAARLSEMSGTPTSRAAVIRQALTDYLRQLDHLIHQEDHNQEDHNASK